MLLSRFALTTALLMSSMLVGAQQLGWPGNTLSGVKCFGVAQGVGPFDYVTEKSKIGIVEQFHFGPKVEWLARGASEYTRNSLDYTLRAVPNHHRALWAMARWYLLKVELTDQNRLNALEGAREGRPPAECYFHRAKRFAPKDGMVPAVFGIYLHKRGKLDEALAEYSLAETLAPKYAELIYNIGLLHFDLDDLDKAKEYADRAAALGYPLTGLTSKIKARHAKSNDGATADL